MKVNHYRVKSLNNNIIYTKNKFNSINTILNYKNILSNNIAYNNISENIKINKNKNKDIKTQINNIKAKLLDYINNINYNLTGEYSFDNKEINMNMNFKLKIKLVYNKKEYYIFGKLNIDKIIIIIFNYYKTINNLINYNKYINNLVIYITDFIKVITNSIQLKLDNYNNSHTECFSYLNSKNLLITTLFKSDEKYFKNIIDISKDNYNILLLLIRYIKQSKKCELYYYNIEKININNCSNKSESNINAANKIRKSILNLVVNLKQKRNSNMPQTSLNSLFPPINSKSIYKSNTLSLNDQNNNNNKNIIDLIMKEKNIFSCNYKRFNEIINNTGSINNLRDNNQNSTNNDIIKNINKIKYNINFKYK